MKPKTLVDAGITQVPRVTGVREGLPLLADDRMLDVKNVIWCTGYQHGFPWINLPIFDENGEPDHEEGIVKNVPGMYFVGLHFLHAMTSATLIGIGRDAERIAKAIACGERTQDNSTSPGSRVEADGGLSSGLRPGRGRKRKPRPRSAKTDPAW